jgi:hypothetical protein
VAISFCCDAGGQHVGMADDRDKYTGMHRDEVASAGASPPSDQGAKKQSVKPDNPNMAVYFTVFAAILVLLAIGITIATLVSQD